jgi:AraC-like DNA-binding protein
MSLELLNSTYFDLNNNSADFFKTIIKNLIEVTIEYDEFYEQEINASLNLILTKLTRLSGRASQKQRTKPNEILNFSKLIFDNVSYNLPVKEYADRLNVTTEKLNEICKEYYGDSPKNIILDKKITESKRLLHFSDLSVKEIAFQLGFEDSSYFSRVFKRKTSLSPSDFKNKST